jgi:hypothetical protein
MSSYKKIIKRRGMNKSEAEVLTLHLNLDKIGMLLNTKTGDYENYEKVLYSVAEFIEGNIHDVARQSIGTNFFFSTIYNPRSIIVRYFSIDTGLPVEVIEKYIVSFRDEFFDMFTLLLLGHTIVIAPEFKLDTYKAHGLIKEIDLQTYKRILNDELRTTPIIKTADSLYTEVVVELSKPTFIQRVKSFLKLKI